MFPWESGVTGVETCCPPSWSIIGDKEVHISGDIAWAVWQYWMATGDLTWLQQQGYPILRGIADFWVSRWVGRWMGQA